MVLGEKRVSVPLEHGKEIQRLAKHLLSRALRQKFAGVRSNGDRQREHIQELSGNHISSPWSL